MSLPDDFSPWQHLLQMLISSHNRRVSQTFVGVPDKDLTTDLGGMKVACLLEEDDTVDMIVLRLLLFYFVYKGRLPRAVYGIPIYSDQAQRKFKPQIKLYFLESAGAIEPGYPPVDGEITIRIMTKTNQTITPGDLTSYANKIKEFFGIGSGYVWRKGKYMVSYTDWDRGYQLQILCRDKASGIALVERILEIQGHTPDFKKLNFNENQELMETYPTIPPTVEILGKPVRQSRRRPIADVHFQYAILLLHGQVNPVILVDPSNTFDTALVR